MTELLETTAPVQPIVVAPAAKLKLNLGSGPSKMEGYLSVDKLSFGGKVDVICDLGFERWPFDDNTVDEAHCSHFIEHLTNFNGKWQRVHFFNELERVLKPGGKCTLILPHWCSNRYYGDPTHCEPWSEMAFYYLSKEWRKANAPHCDSEMAPGPQSYSCDLEASWNYSMHQALVVRNQEYQQEAMQWKKEAVQDIIATIKKKS